MTKDIAYLVLQDGQVFEGCPFGAKKETLGELVFTTGMTGYVETLTDPSYAGQIIMQTFPLIGNYGVMSADKESAGVSAKGYVVREYCEYPSNFRTDMSLDEFLKKEGIPAICGVDTREITKIIREKGVMNARITYEKPADKTDEELNAYAVSGVVEAVTTKTKIELKAQNAKRKVALFDLGTKDEIAQKLLQRGLDVTVMPSFTTAEEVLNGGYDGVMLSNGPGDPQENVGVIAEVKKLIGKLPIFGICLGHQILALANGARTVKLKYGHRGANQPVKDLETGKVYVTSQNHGYAVDAATLPSYAKLRMINVNDSTCEGIDYPQKKAYSVQFHPEACAGPRDTEFLFMRFIDMIEENANA